MRAGFTASLISHAALITLGLVSLHGAQPLEPEEIEAISIDLVPIEEFSNIRAGTLESDVIETEAPSVVETPDAAQLAERTGNTEEDQPTPEETDIATPAPTVETAPAPEARPEPEPEPEAEPEPEPVVAPEPQTAAIPEPAAEPEPEPAPETPVQPELSATPDTPSEDAPVAPQPVLKTAAIDQKRAEFRRRQEEEARRRAAEQAREEAAKAEEADRISDIINAEDSRGATTGTGGQATAGKPTGQAARLTQSEQAALAGQMRECFSPPLGSTSADAARLLVALNRDGSVSGTPQILSVAPTPLGDTLARAAQRAVLRCAPYQLAAEKYEDWQQVDVTFNPDEL